MFDIPAKGPNIVLNEELAGHQTSITDIATEHAQGPVSTFPLPVLVAQELSSPWEAQVWVFSTALSSCSFGIIHVFLDAAASDLEKSILPIKCCFIKVTNIP